ncbi:glycoside hydrolase family 26 protein [Thermostaphylospora chromogena]|uniref:Glycosyl hydrolase family 26 n=1 Tax=Thermostaphylospora chromogena TaxID=35622 RepID=A0A1H0ZZJ7_9ACTN|nr:glycosyl hydrolase [Thermostaphylospora chromogena]SDQ32812.1 Glycosyl hydrolase family 26 [Thermostaphylospora chromogena]
MTRGKRRLARPRGKRRNVWISLAAAAILLIGGGVIYIKHDLVERVVFSVLDRGEKTEEESTLIATAPGPRRPCDSAPTLEQGPACGAWWGVYVPPEGSLRRSVESLERKVGRTFDIVFAYHDMSTTENGELLRDDEPKIGRERLLLLGWESERWELGDNIPWATIASGRLDKEIIDPQAKRIKKYGKPVLIGFDGEMELREDSGTPADYVAAYRHIVDRFRKLGVDNVAWVWAVTGYLDYSKRWKAFYPGDDYVDWISYDPYNFAHCRNAPWRSFEETVRPAYNWFIRNGFGHKPFILSEYGTESDPDRPKARGEWYKDVPRTLKKMPNIKAVLQWNAVDSEGCDFTLTGPGVLDSFAQAGKDPYVKQQLPRGLK